MTSDQEAVLRHYERHLVPPPPAGVGVCEVCAGCVPPPWTRCYGCVSASRTLAATADVVAAISIAVRTRQLAYDLGAYKSNPHTPTRDRLTALFASLLSTWLPRHESCLADAVTAGSAFDVITAVPSTRRRTEQRLEMVVGELSSVSASRFASLLEPAVDQPRPHCPSDEIFRVSTALPGISVLIVDDTWTSGAYAQSAASALRRAGSGPVAILAIGRHFGGRGGLRGLAQGRSYLANPADRPWRPDVCSLCALRPAEASSGRVS